MKQKPFAIWITGLPASGKSTISQALVRELRLLDILPVVLESDRMRKILTPEPSYERKERDRFYEQLSGIGELLYQAGLVVIFDATGNRREYRDQTRAAIARFVEIYVSSPVDICKARDPKGLYAAARTGHTKTVPGIQTVYEPPVKPELTVDGTIQPRENAERILSLLKSLGYI